ncbi:MAG TPA: radical SAM protein [Thermoclostridium caenicola]|uniref:radical SAM protein n=1 Tax=Thermoclostridium caenicola TaxID=659425 RepID=UPI002C882CAD|nr:radical SAM protein [Thermoclostridium caenicola]HOK42454.1 radical SAM protein [Thermoclostridium caenicola]HOL84529.1 radical SAM protein [Thermoclostridium caenicola]HOP72170.1 radical SAM protein [Thermoclostridium caenicola]HPO76661.1 radical SAM protein [Thermoclostridium caenicola]
MKIQSLSVVVPNKKCINNCRFCVSRMHESPYKNMMDENLPFFDLYQRDYIKRLEFARDNGCNTVMLTGNSEPQQNRSFLQAFGTMNNNLSKPFRWIEMQTTGVLLDESYLRFLRNHVGVSTISVSLSAFDDDINAEYNGTLPQLKVNLRKLCALIKKYDFNLRLSVNMTDYFTGRSPEEILTYARQELLADQVTFRVLYTSTDDVNAQTPQDKWILEHGASPETLDAIKKYVTEKGRALEILEFGAVKYSVMGMSTVIDDDCMSTVPKESLKYVILQPNCKLYSKWDDPASLIF